MKRILVWATLFWLWTVLPVGAGALMIFEMIDGARITGRVTAYGDGIYTVASDSLGTVQLPESKIVTIRRATAQKPGSGASVSSGEMAAIRELMMGDPDLKAAIGDLQSDAAVMKILNDAEIMALVRRGDIQALANHPEFLKLLEHAAIQDLVRQMQGRLNP